MTLRAWLVYIVAAFAACWWLAPALPTWALTTLTLTGVGVAAFTSRYTITKEKP